MALDAEHAERRVEEEAPLAVVVVVHVKDDRNVVADGDALDHRGGGWDDGKFIVGRERGVAGVAGRVCHGSGRRGLVLG